MSLMSTEKESGIPLPTFLQEPYPCEGCPMRKTCELNVVCCEDFKTYASTGINVWNNRIPSKRWMRLLNEEGNPKVIESDKEEAIQITIKKGIDIAVAATGIKPYRIKNWLEELTSNRRVANAN